jgi:type IV pilus assembly protein PilX
MKRKCPTAPRYRQRGAALFVSLILLLVLTLIGVTAAQMQTVEERMALNDDNHQLALQSGEAVLLDSESALQNGWYDSNPGTYPFDGTNGTATLSMEAPNGSSIADQATSSANFTGAGAFAYGGPALGGVPVSTPSVALEILPNITLASEGIGQPGYPIQIVSLRTTTLANGADSTSVVVTQSIGYHAPSQN